MNSNSTRPMAAPNEDQLSFDESMELLVDLRCEFQESSQRKLYDFASVVFQVGSYYRREGSKPGGDPSCVPFITAALEEIRRVYSSGKPTSARMDAMQAAAIKRWSRKFVPADKLQKEKNASADSGLWNDSDDNPAHGDDDDVVAPSAEEIGSLLSKLKGKSESAPKSAPEKKAEPKAKPQSKTPPPAPDPTPPAEPAEVADTISSEAIDALDPELREAFLDDAASCVGSIENELLRLEADPKQAQALNQICRELHTLKGASASVGLSDLADQLHEIEDQLREDQEAGRTPEIDPLLRSVDSIRSQIGGGGADSPPPPAPAPAAPAPTPVATAPRVTPPSVTQPGPAAAPAPAPAAVATPPSFSEGPAEDESVRVQSSQLNRLMDMLAELVMLRNRRETELAELTEVYHELIGSVSKMRILSHEGYNQQTSSNSLQLSEVANDVLEVAQHVRDCARPVAEGNEAVSQFIRQFRQELVHLRRTPVSGLFRRLQRVVRDSAQAENKEVKLELVGEDAGIERSLQQRLYEPLLHIVRNSVCHGIEPPEERKSCGKNPVGTITLEGKSGPDLFVIEIRDDGRGLDYDAIRRRGTELGFLSPNQAVSRDELSQLIFQPGFSTRQTANQVAGRGVGMDVVATTLQRMRGWLEVKSEPQKGTRIRLTFPLPSVIQHVMVFRSGSQLFALPMQSVQHAGEVSKDSVCLSFSDMMGELPTTPPEACQRIVLASEATASHDSETRDTRITLLVDEIVGPEEVVVRPLPTLLKQHPFCSGATLSGMGQTVLFLDARCVVEFHLRYGTAEAVDADHLASSTVAEQNAMLARPPVLVVDDSVSARKRVVRSLQRYAVDITEASDGRQALELLKSNKFAAVFSDMEMPHVSGMELLAEINSSDRGDTPPVVIISSRNEEEFTERAEQLGACCYLNKPLTDDALDEAIGMMGTLRHLVSEPGLTSRQEDRSDER